MPVRGGYLALAGGGAILLWSGLKGKSWSQVLKTILQGHDPTTTTTAYTIQSTPGGGNNPANNATALGTNATGGTVAKNQAIARVLAAPYGWSTGPQWDALNWIWTEESGWSATAQNPSGAYGIPQALPGSKMGKYANPPYSFASAQIAWGLSYIRQVYGNPVNAKAFHLAHGWY